MARFLSRIGAFAHRHRLSVIAVWLVVLFGGTAGAVTLAGETSSSFSIPGQESTTALERIGQEFGTDGAQAKVVVRAPEGQTLTTPENAKALGDLVASSGACPASSRPPTRWTRRRRRSTPSRTPPTAP